MLSVIYVFKLALTTFSGEFCRGAGYRTKKKRSNIPALLFGCNSNLSQFTNTVIGDVHTKYISSKTEQMNGVKMLACSYSKNIVCLFQRKK